MFVVVLFLYYLLAVVVLPYDSYSLATTYYKFVQLDLCSIHVYWSGLVSSDSSVCSPQTRSFPDHYCFGLLAALFVVVAVTVAAALGFLLKLTS